MRRGHWSWQLGLIALVFAVLESCPSAADAQPRHRLGVSGAVEFAHTTADDSFLGAGLGWSTGLDLRLTPSTNFGLDVGAERQVRDFRFAIPVTLPDGSFSTYFVGSRSEGTALFFTARLSHAFGRASVRPVIWGGAGLMHYLGGRYRVTDQPTLPPGATLPADFVNTDRGPAVTAGVTEGGAGLEVALHGRFAVTPYGSLRLASSGNAGPKYIIRTGVSVVARW